MLSAADMSAIHTLCELAEDDVDGLIAMKKYAGKGEEGKFELFFLSMAIYYYQNAMAYMRQIVTNYGEAEVTKDVPIVPLDSDYEEPATVEEEVKTLLPAKTTNKLPLKDIAEAVGDFIKKHSDGEEKKTSVWQSGYMSSGYGGSSTSYKGLKKEEVREMIYGLLDDSPDSEIEKSGYVGYLVAETQRKILEKGSGSDPKEVLQMVFDVMDTRKQALEVIKQVEEELANQGVEPEIGL